MGKAHIEGSLGNDRTICLPFTRENYMNAVQDPAIFRNKLNEHIEQLPQLFPAEIAEIGEGYRMKDIRYSKKLGIPIRRITVNDSQYSIRPSFAMPYMTGLADEIEKAIFLRKFGVPYWAISHSFGKYPMYWYRIEQSIGHNSIVGTTVVNPDDIPEDLGADEKHTRDLGEKAYIATTVANECIFGASMSEKADEESLKDAYGVFKDEALHKNPSYEPRTVNTDGWPATRAAWTILFSTAVLICCFLHVFIKIRDRAKRKHQEIFHKVAEKFWNCYKAENKSSFSQRIRRLCEWCVKNSVPEVISAPIYRMRANIKNYIVAYDNPGAHRTSNMLDRLMQRMDRYLFHTQYFHGRISSAEYSIRGWALIQNFAPSNPYTVKKYGGLKSPAERLNQTQYHENWLENLLISASLQRYRRAPQNAL